MARFEGRPILISGAGRGLGEGIAAHLAAEGAIVGVADINGESARDVATAIRDAGGKAFSYEADLGRRQAFFDVAEAFANDAGPLRAVINNASVLVYEPIEQVTEETLDRMLSAGLKSVFWGVQAFLCHREASLPGNILNYSSPVAYRGRPNTAAYTTIKAGDCRTDQGARRRARPARHPRQRHRPRQRADPGDRGVRDAGAVRAAGEEHSAAAQRHAARTWPSGGFPALRRGGIHQRSHARRRWRHHRGGIGRMAKVWHDRLDTLREVILADIARGDYFGAVLTVGRGGEVVFAGAFGAEDGAGERPLKYETSSRSSRSPRPSPTS